jgi:hypothetical protein
MKDNYILKEGSTKQMTPPTNDEICLELTVLSSLKYTVPAHGMFGSDNLAALNAQIETIEKNLSEDQINANFDLRRWADDQRSAALDARRWLDGEDDAPSTGWDYIVSNR